MELFFSFIIFCIVLFFYVHIHYHLKTSNDLEVFDIDMPTKEKFEELCDIRQPITMKYNNSKILEHFKNNTIQNEYGAFDINIRNINTENKTDIEKYVILAYNTANELFNNDSESKYYTENNESFLVETSLIKILQNNDLFLRPYMVSSCSYDLLTGSQNTTTVLKYDFSYRNFIYVTEGDITIKLTPPKNSKYLYKQDDYELLEFRSLINPWNVDKKYEKDYNKIKFLEITLKAGDLIFIPAYWWYSIKYNIRSTLLNMKYKTYMNIVSLTPTLVVHYLQTLNVKFNTERTLSKQDIQGETKRQENTIVVNDEANNNVSNNVSIPNNSSQDIISTEIMASNELIDSEITEITSNLEK